jgi:hypothetical protein
MDESTFKQGLVAKADAQPRLDRMQRALRSSEELRHGRHALMRGGIMIGQLASRLIIWRAPQVITRLLIWQRVLQ